MKNIRRKDCNGLVLVPLRLKSPSAIIHFFTPSPPWVPQLAGDDRRSQYQWLATSTIQKALGHSHFIVQLLPLSDSLARIGQLDHLPDHVAVVHSRAKLDGLHIIQLSQT